MARGIDMSTNIAYTFPYETKPCSIGSLVKLDDCLIYDLDPVTEPTGFGLIGRYSGVGLVLGWKFKDLRYVDRSTQCVLHEIYLLVDQKNVWTPYPLIVIQSLDD